MTVLTTVQSGKPSLPISSPAITLVVCNGVNYYSSELPSSLNGKQCICHVVYRVEYDTIMQAFSGKMNNPLSNINYQIINGSSNPAWVFLNPKYIDLDRPILYVSNSGNDSSSGIDDAYAFKSIAKANSMVQPRYTICLKCGDTFREQIIPVDYVSYISYGNGKKPLILGSVQKNKVSDWTLIEKNIWSASDTLFSIDVGNLIFNNEEYCGIKKKSRVELLKQNDFFYNPVTDSVELYSSGNPADFYTNIECALKKHIIDQSNKKFIKYTNLDLRYGAAHGIGGSNTQNITIDNLDISFIGGGDQFNNGRVRFGNGIELWNGAKNIIVQKCNISNIYDAAITTQGNGTYQKSNITFNKNNISKSEYSIEHWDRDSSTVVNGILYEENNCSLAGGGWGHNQRGDGINGRHLMLFSNTAQTSNVFFRNNIFTEASESTYYISTPIDKNDFVINGNKIIQTGNIGRLGIKDYRTLKEWQDATGQDAHSVHVLN